jgi:hypothetical protein
MAGLPVFPYPQFPPQAAKSVNPDGSMANPFYYLLQALFQRTGTNSGVAQSIGTSISAAGGTQATATALSSNYNFITGGTGGVLLPTMQPGQSVVVFNQTSAAINVYPPTGAAINGLTVNAPISMPAGTNYTFICQSTTAIYTQGTQQQYLSSIVPLSPGLALTTTVSATVTSLALPAGDWTLWGEVIFGQPSVSLTFAAAALWNTAANVSPAAASIPSDGATPADRGQLDISNDDGPTIVLGPMRAQLTTPTTFYLSANAAFSAALVVGGAIRARLIQ